MEEAHADELAHAAVAIHGDGAFKTHTGRRLYEGISLEAQEVIPPTARAAVIQREDNEPMVIAVDDERVWLIEVEPPGDEFEPAAVTTTVYALDRQQDRVSRTAKHHRGSRGPFQSIDWTFEIGGRLVSIPVHVSPNTEPESREQVARALATALGWHVPLDVRDYRIEVL